MVLKGAVWVVCLGSDVGGGEMGSVVWNDVSGGEVGSVGGVVGERCGWW